MVGKIYILPGRPRQDDQVDNDVNHTLHVALATSAISSLGSTATAPTSQRVWQRRGPGNLECPLRALYRHRRSHYQPGE
jgi:hypothetical protein